MAIFRALHYFFTTFQPDNSAEVQQRTTRSFIAVYKKRPPPLATGSNKCWQMVSDQTKKRHEKLNEAQVSTAIKLTLMIGGHHNKTDRSWTKVTTISTTAR